MLSNHSIGHSKYKNRDIAYRVIDITPNNVTCADLTRRFPYQSIRGRKYIMVGYHYAQNVILGKTLKNRAAVSINAAWGNINTDFLK